ncbi:MAG: DUF5320 domain-containing protein [Candidatus Paceibacterota bacterium]|jgi:hypothetical protein
MPRFDGTGPMGTGPATGRGMGPCAGRLGLGRRFCRFWAFGAVTEKEEKDLLERDVEALEDELKAAKTRLEELKGKK